MDLGLPEELSSERMLGVMWDPVSDTFKFQVRIDLSPIKHKSRLGPDITKEELQRNSI